MLPLYLRLDGMVVATAPTDDSNWIQIEEAARIVREHNERKARMEVRVSGPHMAPDGIGGWVLKDGPYMSIPLPASPPVSPAPSDQLEQLPEPCIPCCLNQGLTEAARRIVDLEEERDALKARVEELTTDLQTAKDALQEWMEEHRLTEEAGGAVARAYQERDDALGRATLAERRAIQAERRVEVLREALEASLPHLTTHDIDMLIRETGGNYDQYVRAGYQLAKVRLRDAISATDEGKGDEP